MVVTLHFDCWSAYLMSSAAPRDVRCKRHKAVWGKYSTVQEGLGHFLQICWPLLGLHAALYFKPMHPPGPERACFCTFESRISLICCDVQISLIGVNKNHLETCFASTVWLCTAVCFLQPASAQLAAFSLLGCREWSNSLSLSPPCCCQNQPEHRCKDELLVTSARCT